MKNTSGKTILGIIIAAIVALLLSNPHWLPISDSLKESLEETEKNNMIFHSNSQTTIAQIITLVLAIVVIWLIYQVLKLILSAMASRGGRTQTVINLIAGLLKYVAVIVAIVWGLSILGVNATAVLAGVGIIGLILGFGAQSLIEDIITGAFIIFENQYSVGDVIILDDFRGTVRNIGVRNISTALAVVAVAYKTDLRKLEKMLAEKLPKLKEEHPDLYLNTPKYLGVDELADSGINLKFAVDVKEENIFNGQRMLARDLKILFDENGVEIPFPQVVVHKAD